MPQFSVSSHRISAYLSLVSASVFGGKRYATAASRQPRPVARRVWYASRSVEVGSEEVKLGDVEERARVGARECAEEM